MAIAPEMLQKNFQKEVDCFESMFDSKLVKSTMYAGDSLSLGTPVGFTTKHFNVLRLRYIAAGWDDVVWRSEQRNGNWLEFVSHKENRKEA